MRVNTAVSEGQEILVAKACESVWQGIAFDVPGDSVTAKEMVELSADASRLELNGYSDEQQWFSKMVSELGYTVASERIAKQCSFSAYEASGNQEW